MVPFVVTSNRTDYTEDVPGQTYISSATRVEGVASLGAEALVLQFRSRQRVQRITGTGYQDRVVESEVSEVQIPLTAIRAARVERRWWRLRLRVAAADLRPFAGVPGFSGTELVLSIARADRLDAEELASHIELALARRLLGDPLAPPRLS